ncbi:MAG: HPF/RaiA family ribosome-associated protein [Patescibacteria group bacterium]
MRVEVRSRDRSHKLNRSLLSSIEQLFQKLDKYVRDPAYIEISLEHLHRRKKGGTHYVHATAVIPGEPTTFHVEVTAEDFRTGCDRVYEKLERHLRQHGDRARGRERRQARREKLTRMFQESMLAPRRLLEGFRRRSRAPKKA